MRSWFRSVRARRIIPALAALALAASGASFAIGAGVASAATTASAPACTTSDISWTPTLPNSPFTTTVTLIAPAPGGSYPTCSVSLNSYDASGPTWQSSDPQAFLDHVQATLSATNTFAVLTVTAPACFGQTDLYGGTTRYDGTDGALPNFTNNVVTPDNLIDHWNGGTACGVTPPPPVPVTPASPIVTNASCNGVTPGSITGPVGIVVTDSTGSVVPNAASLAAGTYTVTLDAGVGVIFAPSADYTLNTAGNIATWSETISNPICAQTPPAVGIPAPTVSATGTLAESCPTEAGVESFTVTLTNTGTANLTFSTSVNGTSVESVPGFAPNSVYTFTGTLPQSTPSSAITASFTSGGTTTAVPLSINGGTDAFPCVLGETITKPTAPGPVVAPPVGVEPVTVAKPPAAALPFTGLPELSIAVVGFGLIGGGAALVLTTRRRKADQLG
jgi:hypothetical protein